MIDAFEILLQNPGGAHGFGHHGTAGDDGEVFALVAVVGFELGLEGIDEVRGLRARRRITFALPNTNGVFSSVMTGVASRAKRRYFGSLTCCSSR